MKVKKFTAPTTREALRKLRAELGEDAIILSTRQTASGTEVLAAASEELDSLTAAVEKRASQATAKQATSTEATEPLSWTKADREKLELQRKRAEAVQKSVNEQIRAQMEQRPARPAANHEGLAAMTKAQSAKGNQPMPAAKPSSTAATRSVAAQYDPMPKSPSQAPETARFHQETDDMLNDVSRTRAQAASEAMVNEQAQVLEEIKQMRQMMKDQMSLMTWRDSMERNPLRAEIWTQLNNAGFSPLFARTVAERLPEDLTESAASDWLQNVLKRNLSVIRAEDDIVDQGGSFALVGPTGVGKTTTTAKLAARCVVKYGADSLGLITTDSYRIGAQDQLRIYGKILGVQVYTAQNEADLGQLRSSLGRKRLLLIDTVGMGQRDKRVGEQTQMLVDSHIKRLLLLNSTSQPETLDDVVRHYMNRGLHGAILTKLDESIKIGGVLDVVMRHKLQLHYMATGQRVPEDLFLADPKVLVHRALKPRHSSAFKASDEEMKWKMTHAAATAP